MSSTSASPVGVRYCAFSGRTKGQGTRGIGRGFNPKGSGRCVGQTAPTKARHKRIYHMLSARQSVESDVICVDISTYRIADREAR